MKRSSPLRRRAEWLSAALSSQLLRPRRARGIAGEICEGDEMRNSVFVRHFFRLKSVRVEAGKMRERHHPGDLTVGALLKFNF